MRETTLHFREIVSSIAIKENGSFMFIYTIRNFWMMDKIEPASKGQFILATRKEITYIIVSKHTLEECVVKLIFIYFPSYSYSLKFVT